MGACVIDSGYDGEVFINLHNVGHMTQTIEAGTKIAQIVMEYGCVGDHFSFESLLLSLKKIA